MNSRALRRLAADHSALHNQPLPPNYLFPPTASATSTDDLTTLDILLAGPTHTPFSTGLWTLHLAIPHTYPTDPPTAHFRTPIFHPNVDPATGAVCVETLKRDWDAKLTLRDVLVTISCLLIQPNPDSALNAEAGALIREDFRAFARRAELLVELHARVPEGLRGAVKEAQERGQDGGRDERVGVVKRRRGTARFRGTAALRREDGSPSSSVAGRRRQQPEQQNGSSASQAGGFVVQTSEEDVFGAPLRTERPATPILADAEGEDEDSSMHDADDQENDASRSPTKATATPPHPAAPPRRPQGIPVPLGELTTVDHPSAGETSFTTSSEEDDSGMEAEYPPSPSKNRLSPKKAQKRKRPAQSSSEESAAAAESSSSHQTVAAATTAANITPPNNPFLQPLAESSPFFSHQPSTDQPASPRKTPLGKRPPLFSPQKKASALFSPSASTPEEGGGIFRTRTPSSSEKKRKRRELDAELWEKCGRDVRRWNRGEFEGMPFKVKAGRW